MEFSEEDVSKGDFPHYMLKEIFEQPATIRDAMRGRLSREEATAKLGGLGHDATPNCARWIASFSPAAAPRAMRRMCRRIHHRALAHVPCEVEFASEFRYRNMPMTRDTLVFCL